MVIKVQPEARFSEMQVFSGLRRTDAPSIMDIMLEWDLPGTTEAKKAALEVLFYTQRGVAVTVVASDGSEWTAFPQSFDAPEPRDGLWYLSGSFRVNTQVVGT